MPILRDFDAVIIADSVHGVIGLSEVEKRIVDSRSFQRLRRIKQLGLADLVYPDASFSRFSHCLGACHVTGLLIEGLRAAGETIEPYEVKLHRLAALLHDVGHYPFSHAMEEALRNAAVPLEDGSGGAQSVTAFPTHEELGASLCTADPDIRDALCEDSIDPASIGVLLNGRIPQDCRMNMISGDFDADRLDYLARTALHTGLPYGSVDLEYLVSRVRLDAQRRLCLSRKARRAADHLLLCRYFDRLQVAYHRTVVGMEETLRDVIGECWLRIVSGMNCSQESIAEAVRSGQWYAFDEAVVLRELSCIAADPSENAHIQEKARAVVRRIPPAMVWEKEWLGSTDIALFRTALRLVNASLPELARKTGREEALWHVWKLPGFKLTALGSHVSYASLQAPETTAEKVDALIRIVDDREGSTRESRLLVEERGALAHILSDHRLYMIRVYAHLGTDPQGRASLAREARRHALDVLGDDGEA